MQLLRFLFVVGLAASCYAENSKSTFRGKLTQREGQSPALQTADGKLIALDGDGDTKGVLKDKRLAGSDLEVTGQLTAAGLLIDPIHTKAMYVHKDGKRLLITYWCDVCSIRTYTPGICWCCQQETELDLRGPDKP